MARPCRRNVGHAVLSAQQLNLSFAFQAIQDLGSYSAFSAAPVLTKDLSLDDELPPSGFQSPRTSDGYAAYDQGAGAHPFDIVAACNMVTSPAITVPESQGIPIISAYRADWQQEFLLGVSGSSPFPVSSNSFSFLRMIPGWFR